MRRIPANTQTLPHIPSRMNPHLLACKRRAENRSVENTLLQQLLVLSCGSNFNPDVALEIRTLPKLMQAVKNITASSEVSI